MMLQGIVASSLFALLLVGAFSTASPHAYPQKTEKEKLRPKVVALDTAGKDYLQVVGGPPESVTMKSGLVALAHGKSVGKHSTGQHEELLVILEGKGEMVFGDGSKLPVEAGHALYCPPETEHNVTNTGTDPLRYV
jgi:mannose-6-phosphate isomerase-like protein (cupin superfamily)